MSNESIEHEVHPITHCWFDLLGFVAPLVKSLEEEIDGWIELNVKLFDPLATSIGASSRSVKESNLFCELEKLEEKID